MSTIATLVEKFAARHGRPNVFVAVFGAYLAVHFAQLLSVSGELFSSSGVLADAGASPFFGRFPGLYFFCDAPWFVQTTIALAIIASVTLMSGRHIRGCAIALLVVLSGLFVRNPLISNPSMAYVGFALLVLAVSGRAPSGVRRAVGSDAIFTAVLLVVGASYTFAGLEKLGAPSWRDGTALAEVLASPLARSGGIAEVLRVHGAGVLRLATWGSLGLEVAALLLLMMRRTRLPTVLALIALHLGILLTVNFADLTLGMLAVHVLFFDPDWLREAKSWRAARGRA